MSYKLKSDNRSVSLPVDVLNHISSATDNKNIKYLCSIYIQGASFRPYSDIKNELLSDGLFTEKETELAEAYLCGAGLLGPDSKIAVAPSSKALKVPQQRKTLNTPEEDADSLTSDSIKQWMEKDNTRKDFVKACEDVYGNVFNKTELMTVIAYSEEYRLKDECILAILGYSRENGYGIAYTRKLFTRMVENNINTLDEVNSELNFLSEHSSYVTNIKQIFGLSRALSSSEKPRVERWHKEFKFTGEMIQLAFDKAASMKGDKATIAYCDKILTSWREEGLITADDVKNKLESGKTQTIGKIQTTYSLSDFFNAAVERSYSDETKNK